MNRPTLVTLGVASALAMAACTSAGAGPTWTFPPGSPTAAPATATPVPATATPAPTPSPTPITLGTEDAPRVVEVSMGNFFYEPETLTVQLGETIRFVIENPTTIDHELVIGTAEEQEHHAMEMAEGMEGHDEGGEGHGMADEPNEVEVEPGETVELVWTFDELGELLMGCHVVGHYEAGMVGTVEVVS